MATRGAAPTELKYRAKGGCLQRRLKTDRLIIDNNLKNKINIHSSFTNSLQGIQHCCSIVIKQANIYHYYFLNIQFGSTTTAANFLKTGAHMGVSSLSVHLEYLFPFSDWKSDRKDQLFDISIFHPIFQSENGKLSHTAKPCLRYNVNGIRFYCAYNILQWHNDTNGVFTATKLRLTLLTLLTQLIPRTLRIP